MANEQQAEPSQNEKYYRDAYEQLSLMKIVARMDGYLSADSTLKKKIDPMPEDKKFKVLGELIDWLVDIDVDCRMEMFNAYPKEKRERIFSDVVGPGDFQMKISLLSYEMAKGIFDDAEALSARKIYVNCVSEKKKSVPSGLKDYGL